VTVTRERNHVGDLRGATRLAAEATKAVTDLVEAMHVAIGAGPAVLGRPFERVTRRLTSPVYATIRTVTERVGAGVDVALAQLASVLGESTSRPEHEAVLAALNGVLGDYLDATENPLAIEMRFRHGGRPLALEQRALAEALPQVGGKLLVLVHGSCLNDLQWRRNGHDHGAALACELGYTPVYLHYNSGLHISSNGKAMAGLLEQLVSAWPMALDELVIVGHSMGGLVSRSACHYAEVARHDWRSHLQALVCLGSPHHGAPLERGGNWFEVLLGISRYSAPLARLGRIRSAGVTDMRFGSVLDEDWEGRDRFALGDDCRSPLPLPKGVRCHAVAGTTAPGPTPELPSDGLVPVDSALGRCARPELSLDFPAVHQLVTFGTKHLDLLDRSEVYAALASWLASGTESADHRKRPATP
jgi:pimeloyl-ACP methyl ester carboxylesterase